MAELRLGTWNMAGAPMDEQFDPDRMHKALTVAWSLNVDILGTPELGVRSHKGTQAEQDRLGEVTRLMLDEGYHGIIVPTADLTVDPDQRDPHYLAVWSRLGPIDKEEAQKTYGSRHALKVYVPGLQGAPDMTVTVAHGDDRYKAARKEMITAVIEDTAPGQRAHMSARQLVAGQEPVGEAVIMEDFNAMWRPSWQAIQRGELVSDWRALAPWVLGQLGVGAAIERLGIDFYDDAHRIQRILGFVARAAGMPDDVRTTLVNAGYHNANRHYQPTCFNKGLSYAIDDFYGSPGVQFSDFTIHKQTVSDHAPLTVVAHY